MNIDKTDRKKLMLILRTDLQFNLSQLLKIKIILNEYLNLKVPDNISKTMLIFLNFPWHFDTTLKIPDNFWRSGHPVLYSTKKAEHNFEQCRR